MMHQLPPVLMHQHGRELGGRADALVRRKGSIIAAMMHHGCTVRNHNSMGMKRPYLHELSIDHLHYGVIQHFPVWHAKGACFPALTHFPALARFPHLHLACIPVHYRLSSRRADSCPNTPLVCHVPCCTSVIRTAVLLHVITYYCACSPYPFCVQ
jgi:hypothetical protein